MDQPQNARPVRPAAPGQLLDGIKILSLAEQYPGPYATLLMADLGADVVIVERPGSGDPSRAFPGFFEALNRGKRSIALDLKSADGRTTARSLAEAADVVLDGFRPGTLERLGLGPDELLDVNERLVYARISGFGQTGPYRLRAAHDLSYLAASGVLHDRLGTTDTSPHFPLAVGDLSSGMFATIGVLAGLLRRQTTGRGCVIDLSMTDGLVSWMSTQLVPVLNGLPVADFNAEPAYGIFETADGGLLTLSIAHEDSFWSLLCRTIGLHQVADLDAEQRRARSDELKALIRAVIITRNRDDWAELLAPLGVPAAPVLSLAEVAGDPSVVAREMVVEVPADDHRPMRRHIRQPLVIDGIAPRPTTHAPDLGEHGADILRSWLDPSR